MKKRTAAVTVLLAAAVFLAGCGDDSKKAWLDEIKASDYVKLGEYKGIEVSQAKPAVTEEERDSYISYFLKMDPDRGVIEGDTVNIDYVGTKDGTAFEGGTASGASLTIGSGSFIEGFEDGLIGAKKGDTVELNLQFPADYRATELAGQDVVFTVTVNSILAGEEQELTDGYVKGLGIDGVETVDAYRQYVYDMLLAQAEQTYDTNVENLIADEVISRCEFTKDPPQAMVERYTETLKQNLTNQAASYGMDLMQFLGNYGMDESNYEENLKSQAVKSAQQYIVLKAIADAEKISVSDEEIQNSMDELAKSSGYESSEDIGELVDTRDYSEFLLGQKVMDMLRENAVVSGE